MTAITGWLGSPTGPSVPFGPQASSRSNDRLRPIPNSPDPHLYALPTSFPHSSGRRSRHGGSYTQETHDDDQDRSHSRAQRPTAPEPQHDIGTALITTGVAALGAEAVARIVKTIAVYDDFCHANDPYEEHDFGSFEVDGQTIFFKIDYYDKALASTRPTRLIRRSPSASSPSCWPKNTDGAPCCRLLARPCAER